MKEAGLKAYSLRTESKSRIYSHEKKQRRLKKILNLYLRITSQHGSSSQHRHLLIKR